MYFIQTETTVLQYTREKLNEIKKLTSNIKSKKYPEVFERTCEIKIVGIIYRVYTYISFNVTKLPNSPSARK